MPAAWLTVRKPAARFAKLGKDVIADVVAESGDLVYEPGILKDMQCMSRGLAGHAVVRAKAGDRGRCLTGYEFSRGDALAQYRGDADVCPRVCPVPATAGRCGCLLIANRYHDLSILD